MKVPFDVICVEGATLGLTVGSKYKVICTSPGYYILENDDRLNGNQAWYSNRFKIVEPEGFDALDNMPIG